MSSSSQTTTTSTPPQKDTSFQPWNSHRPANLSTEELRAKQMAHCNKLFLQEGTKGALICGILGGAFFVSLPFISPWFRRYLRPNGQAFLTSSAAVAGFWIWGETASLQCARDVTWGEGIKK
eukprot:TRINITY_DN5404_c1_g2_i1.p1 TRINITY_DN5404_c1_g2~~TRINITY_DN5404_c1_g2_i1.p1  ORF type:complete len:136 (+),score=12.83 TRINITY_DN5404_c1_g2_i1:44-409(+)